MRYRKTGKSRNLRNISKIQKGIKRFHSSHFNLQIVVQLQHSLHTFEMDPAFDYFTVERIPVREVEQESSFLDSLATFSMTCKSVVYAPSTASVMVCRYMITLHCISTSEKLRDFSYHFSLIQDSWRILGNL